jgi:hypothetical protein
MMEHPCPLYTTTHSLLTEALIRRDRGTARLGVLRAETVANRSGARSEAYWTLCKPAIERYRGEWKMDALYEGFEYLRQRVVEVNRERDVSALTQESIRGLLEDELGLVEEERPPPQSEGG